MLQDPTLSARVRAHQNLLMQEAADARLRRQAVPRRRISMSWLPRPRRLAVRGRRTSPARVTTIGVLIAFALPSVLAD